MEPWNHGTRLGIRQNGKEQALFGTNAEILHLRIEFGEIQ
jgi:hypothetical protein